jgi:signal transduction histidine kinase
MTLARRWGLDALAWLLVVAVFLLDLVVPEGTAIGLLYVVVMLLGLWTPGARGVLYLAAFATALSLIEFWASPVEGDLPAVISNHILQVIVIWITALGVHAHRRTLIARARAERHAQESEARLREQAALAQIGKMAAVVAHEVRNPLAGIRAAMQVLSRRLGADAPEQKVTAEVVTRVDTLSEIVQDLLQFARPRQPAPVETPFHPLVRTTVELLRNDPAMSSVTVDIHGEDVRVYADAELIKLVFHNLIVNSAQAMDGKGRIEILAECLPGACEIRVSDNGPGIPPAVRQHLFEPFFTTKHRGTGLGLATARRLVEAHGGTLALTCPPSGGTTAVLRLPRANGRQASANCKAHN